ncbi:MAG TPA: 7-cyano-7-deazaguanine synthase QueC [Pirellulales bacterium]
MPASPRLRAVVLLSGGLDSATTAAVATDQGYEVYGLSVDYGQRHRFELTAAARVAESLRLARHETIRLDLSRFLTSALTTSGVDVPKNRPETEMAEGIPVTYVPARNTIMLSLALGWAETLGAADIFIGVNAIDYSGYPDCRPEFIAAFDRLANLGTKAGVEGQARFTVHTPLVRLTKAEIIQKAVDLKLDLGLTHSCYDPSPEGIACGRCDACTLRKKGFHEAGLVDPIPYQV